MYVSSDTYILDATSILSAVYGINLSIEKIDKRLKEIWERAFKWEIIFTFSVAFYWATKIVDIILQNVSVF